MSSQGRLASKAGSTRSGRWFVFHTFVVTKIVFSGDPYGGESFLQRFAYFALVPITLGAIEVPEAGSESSRVAVIVTTGSGIKVQAEGGHLADTMGEGDFGHSDILISSHLIHLHANSPSVLPQCVH